MKINFWQWVEAVCDIMCGVLIFISKDQNKGVCNNLRSLEGLQRENGK